MNDLINFLITAVFFISLWEIARYFVKKLW